MRKMGFALLCLTMAGCASMTKSRDQANIDAIKKIAVVAFHVDMPASAEKGMGLGSGSIIAENTTDGEKIFTELQNSLKRNMKWSVIDTKTMTANTGYTSAYKQTMTGFQNKMPVPESLNRHTVKDVMDWDSARILDVDGRDKLAKDLGVDAVVAAWVTVRFSGTTVMGFGNRKPQTTVSFQVYKSGIEKPVWFESFTGKESTESVGATGFIDEVLMSRLALESAKDAYSQIRNQ